MSDAAKPVLTWRHGKITISSGHGWVSLAIGERRYPFRGRGVTRLAEWLRTVEEGPQPFHSHEGRVAFASWVAGSIMISDSHNRQRVSPHILADLCAWLDEAPLPAFCRDDCNGFDVFEAGVALDTCGGRILLRQEPVMLGSFLLGALQTVRPEPLVHTCRNVTITLASDHLCRYELALAGSDGTTLLCRSTVAKIALALGKGAANV